MKKLLILLPFLVTACGDYVCMEDVPDDFVMTENTAIKLTGNALQNKGLALSEFEAVAYSKDGVIFARNVNDSNTGYVMWHKKSNEQNSFDYSVSIRRKNSKFVCDVSDVK